MDDHLSITEMRRRLTLMREAMREVDWWHLVGDHPDAASWFESEGAKVSAEKRIKALLENEERTPEKDGAGIITPAGYEAAIRAEAYRVCLAIVEDNNCNRNPKEL